MATLQVGQPLPHLVHVVSSGGILTEESQVRLRDNPYHDSDLRLEVYGEKGERVTETVFESRLSEFWVWATSTWDEIAGNVDDLGISTLRGRWAIPFFRYLGYEVIYQRSNEVIEGPTAEQSIRVNLSHRGWDSDEAPRIHIVLSSESFDSPADSDRNEVSPHDALQRFLVLKEGVDWGFLFNGRNVRLLRKYYHEYSRGFVEFDLENILEDRNLTEFRLMYMLLHANVFSGEKSIEGFYERSRQTGVKIGDRLRDNVKNALECLANDLLTDELKRHYEENPEEIDEFFTQLLRVFYRVMFILYAEQRGMLPGQGTLFGREYSVTKLRGMAEGVIVPDSDVDLWRGLQTTFNLVETGSEALGVYAYNGGLFKRENTSLIDPLTCKNSTVLEVIRLLTTTEERRIRSRISYVDIDVEEIGSVYESLLDYKPSVLSEGRVIDKERYFPHRFYLLPRGLERKTTGSYYTDKGLVNILVKTALVPVVNARLRRTEEVFRDKDSEECLVKKREALLDVKVCDPACGGGTFLIAALDYLGLRYAQLVTRLDHPSDDELRDARRTVLMHCIYGVDRNPMAVELAKISLWLHASVKDRPLTFLDHRLKCGDSLIGASPEVVSEGINSDAFTPLKGQKATGIPPEDREVAKRLRRVTLERRKRAVGMASLGSYFEGKSVSDYVEGVKKLDDLGEDTPDQINLKSEYYEAILRESSYQHQKDVYDTWLASFFWDLTSDWKKQVQYERICPTEVAFREVIGNRGNAQLLQKVHEYSTKYRFFNWNLEFPDVFEREVSGFDCILTNPPWEVWKLEEEEFFAGKAKKVEEKKNQSARRNEIIRLQKGNERERKLHQEYVKAWTSYLKTSSFFSKSGQYNLSARGQLNTFQLFVERCWGLVSNYGRSGMVVPTGIATNYFSQDLFAALIKKNSLLSFFDFENREAIFPIHRSFRFSLLTMGGGGHEVSCIPMAFFLLSPQELSTYLNLIPEDNSKLKEIVTKLSPESKLFAFTVEDFEALNPNTLTCPIFRTRKDAELTRYLYKQAPILIKKDRKTGKILSNPWNISFLRMLDMSNDAQLFRTMNQLEQIGAKPIDNNNIGGVWRTEKETFLPLYEGKMIWHYDHRYNSVTQTSGLQGTGEATTQEQHMNADYSPIPRYWVERRHVETSIPTNYKLKWFHAFRDIARSTDTRTIITTIIPRYAVGNKLPILLSNENLCLLLANMNSIVFDYIVRQKIAGISMNFFYVQQFPTIMPDSYDEKTLKYITDAVIELLYTSNDMKALAEEYGYIEKPFSWNEDRRALLMAKLDAIYASLYNLSKENLKYILEQFPVLKKNEHNKYGEYRTKRLVLEAYDQLKSEEKTNE